MANTASNKPVVERITTVERSPMDNLQMTYESNKKVINGVVGIVLALIVGFFAYQKLYKEPREQKAATAISYPQTYFEVDSLQKSLQGDGQHAGFLKIISKYSGTKAANLSHYYAGVAYLRTGDFINAIKHLEDFDGKGTMVGYAAWGALGDAYMESGNVKKGIEYYNKAASDKDNAVISPMFLYRAAMAYEMNNQPEDAKKAYLRVRDEYPQSMQARDVDRNLAKLGVLD